MRNRFLLFGQEPFDEYANRKFSAIAAGIRKMSDVEVLMYRDTFSDLITNILKMQAFQPLEISFENKLVDLVGKPGYRTTRYFAEYSLVVKGNPYFLTLSPFSSGYRPVDLMVEVRENFMSFEIDTNFHKEELTPAVTAHIKKEYDRIKRYIVTTQESLNDTIEYYNRQMQEFVTRCLADKMRKAERGVKIRQSLDFE